MPRSEDNKAKGPVGFIMFAAMCVLLLVFAVWQPSAELWISEPASADALETTSAIAATEPPAVPMRKPIQPNAWAQVIPQEKTN